MDKRQRPRPKGAAFERANVKLKVLDKYLGIPLIAMLSMFKKKRQRPEAVARIGILRTAAIGDTVLLSAIAADLRRHFERVEIILFTGSSNAEVASWIKGVQVVRLPVKDPLRCIRVIRRHPCDLWLDTGSWPRLDALLSAFSGARYTVGFQTQGQHKHYLYDSAVTHDRQRHELHNYRALLERIGVAGESAPYFEIVAEELFSNQIAVHLFPGGSQADLKRWPEERWVALINHLTGDGYRVALTGAEADRIQAERLRATLNAPNQVSVAAGMTLEETARLLKTCCLVISIDTGIMHLASALQCKLVALHGPTAPERWGPLNKDAIVVQPASDCLHCISLGFETCSRKKRCIDEISVVQVLAACSTLLIPQKAPDADLVAPL